jgi:hypothetical protein
LNVTAAAQPTRKLREPEHGTCRAWRAYSASVRDLVGEEYERVEQRSWIELQWELRRIDRQRGSSANIF